MMENILIGLLISGIAVLVRSKVNKNKVSRNLVALMIAGVFIILLSENSSALYKVSANYGDDQNQIEYNIEECLFSLPDYPYQNKRKANKVMKIYKKAMKADIEDFVYLEEVSKGGFFTESKIHYKKTINEEKAVYRYYGKLNKKNEPDGTGILLEVFNNNLYDLEDINPPKFMVAVYYIGGFKNGFKNGYGIEYSNRYEEHEFVLKYEGNFKKGKYNGKGTAYLGVDRRVDLAVRNELLSLLNNALMSDSTDNKFFPYIKGNKLITYPVLLTNKYYDGKFKEGSYNGKGKIYEHEWDDVSLVEYDYIRYNGKFKNGKYEGKGTLYFDKEIAEYKGAFKNGKYHGKGILYDRKGNVLHKGKFKNGEIA